MPKVDYWDEVDQCQKQRDTTPAEDMRIEEERKALEQAQEDNQSGE